MGGPVEGHGGPTAVLKTIISVLKIKTYALIAAGIALAMAIVIPILTLTITGIWIYNVTIGTLPTLLETLTSYALSGVFLSLFVYSRRNYVRCRSGTCVGAVGTALSFVGCCSPIVYVLFIVGLISSAVVPFLAIIPPLSILLLAIATYLLARVLNERTGS